METQLGLDVGEKRSVPTSAHRSAGLGEVFTRRWVVDLILDLAGYTADRDLGGLRVVEPACGEGAFLGPMMDRLLASAATYSRSPEALGPAIRAYDLSPVNVEQAQKDAASRLVDAGLATAHAHTLAEAWIICDDFLLADSMAPADFVVGNPPYLRLEDVPAVRTEAYRRACPTMRGRSDVYVGFIEKGLRLLADGGVLAFIVADRWMHNQYGAGLRRLVGAHFAVDAIIEMHDVDAFEDEVSAYPAVTVIRRGDQGPAVLAHAEKDFGPARRNDCGRGRPGAVGRRCAGRRFGRSVYRRGFPATSSGRPATRSDCRSSPISRSDFRLFRTRRHGLASVSGSPAGRIPCS